MASMLLDGFFSQFGVGNYIMLAVLVIGVVVLYIWGSHYKEKDGHAEMLQRRYARLDEETLAAVPDDQLVEAVAANVLAKVDKRRPDAYRTVTQQTHGRNVVYCVWLICKELDEGSFDELLQGPSSVFVELAADGLEALGAMGCSMTVRSALAAKSEEERAELHADFLEQAEEEKPLDKCVEYIRDNPQEFIDEE